PLSHFKLKALASTDIYNPIPAATLQLALTSPPFIPSRSLINIRNLSATPGSALTPSCIYCCSTLNTAAAGRNA
ncbi:hypothetical protein EDB80DRAFT_590017, partial [Ilyonectria destructans]